MAATKDRIASLLGSVRKAKATKDTQLEMAVGPFTCRIYAGRGQKKELTGQLACKCSLPSWHFSSSIYLGELIVLLDELGVLESQPGLIAELEHVSETIRDPETVKRIVNATKAADAAKSPPAAESHPTTAAPATAAPAMATPSTADRLAALKSAAAIG